MTLSLTCSCGARLQIDDKFAGQPISCPDCQQSLTAPKAGRGAVRTSGFAVASFVLALVGAFTVIGTLVAVALGMLALVDIRRHGDTIAGRGYAVAGIVLGIILTGLSLFAYVRVELFGLDSLCQPQWTGKLEYEGAKEIKAKHANYALTPPSDKWGKYKKDSPPGLVDFSSRDDLLLVNVAEDGYLVCWPEPVPEHWSLDQCREQALQDFRDADLIMGPGSGKANLGVSQTVVRPPGPLPNVGDAEVVEMVVEKRSGSQRRTFLLRVIRKPRDSQMYLLAGGTVKHRFAHLEPQLRKALDSFHLLDGAGEW